MRIRRGTVAVVTGGASGIGLGLAEALAKRGAKVVLADIRKAALEPALQYLLERGAEVAVAEIDVSNLTSVTSLATQTVNQFGRVDLVCNNAGIITPGGPLWEQQSEAWDRMISVKLRGVVNGVTAFAPYLVAQGEGHFLNTASSAGLSPLPGRTPYTTVMHAVVGLTETLDLELKDRSPNLGATVLSPGRVDTSLGRNSAELGATGFPAAGLGPVQDDIEALSALEVGEQALAAIEAGKLHVAPGMGVLERARIRVERLLTDLEPSEFRGGSLHLPVAQPQ